jgi:hypothetical protein
MSFAQRVTPTCGSQSSCLKMDAFSKPAKNNHRFHIDSVDLHRVYLCARDSFVFPDSTTDDVVQVNLNLLVRRYSYLSWSEATGFGGVSP